MAESNSQPTRCPCGFFGSAQTLGLCSKCFSEREQNRDQQLTADASRSSNHVSTAADMINASIVMQLQQQQQQQQDSSSLRGSSSASDFRLSPTDDITTSATTSESSSAIENIIDATTDDQQGTKRKRDEVDDGEEESESVEPDVPLPVQKNRKRCFTCNCRLDLANQAIGKCKCDYVFCPLHRMPEQHQCSYDHKENSRQEARAKMVTFKKHVGTALKRLDSDS